MSDSFLENWAIQIRKGILEFCLLSAIAGQRRYGYEIVKRLAAVPGLGISEGTVYPILSRLRGEELIEASLEESAEGPARKYYSLTPHGRRHLAEMHRHWQDIVNAVKTLAAERTR